MSKQRNSTSLLSDLKSKVVALKEAIKRIEDTKIEISSSASEAKSDIRTVISRQLETLRNREVWLLEQVDLIQNTKQEELSSQSDELWQTLGHLDNCIDCLKSLSLAESSSQSHDLSNIHTTVTECLERFEQLDLEPTENSHIKFNSEQSALRENIQTFGQVESNPLPAAMAFAAPGSTSTSLPQAFEDYEDDEQHVLYKTLQDTRATNHVVNFCAPRSKLRAEDWLYIPTDIEAEPVPITEPLYPPFQLDVSQWLAKRNLAGSTSIHQWLKDIQGQGRLEEDEDSYDVVSTDSVSVGTPTSSGGDLPSPEAGEVATSLTFPYFLLVQNANTDQWLSNARPGGSDLVAGYPRETMRYFREISNNTKDWLYQYEDTKTQDEDADICCKSTCSPARSAAGGDIENLGMLTCVQNPVHRYFQNVSRSDAKAWLVGGNRSEARGGYQNEARVPPIAPSISELCRANEPCDTFSDCVCDDNCCQVTASTAAKNARKNSKEEDNTISWLANKTSISSSEPYNLNNVVEFSFFKKMRSDSLSGWVKNDNQGQRNRFAGSRAGYMSKSSDSISSGKNAESLSSPFTTCYNHSDWLQTKVEQSNHNDNVNNVVRSSPLRNLNHYRKWLSMESEESESIDGKWLANSSPTISYTHRKMTPDSDLSPFKASFKPHDWLSNSDASSMFSSSKASGSKESLGSKTDELPEISDDDYWLQKGGCKPVVMENNWVMGPVGSNSTKKEALFPCFGGGSLGGNSALSEWLLQKKLF